MFERQAGRHVGRQLVSRLFLELHINLSAVFLAPLKILLGIPNQYCFWSVLALMQMEKEMEKEMGHKGESMSIVAVAVLH